MRSGHVPVSFLRYGGHGLENGLIQHVSGRHGLVKGRLCAISYSGFQQVLIGEPRENDHCVVWAPDTRHQSEQDLEPRHVGEVDF